MNFYDEWKKHLISIDANKKYTKRFLDKDDQSLYVLENGNNEELINTCKFLLSIPIDNFIYCIDSDKKCTPNMIIQYSNFVHAIVDVSRVLKFSDCSLTYSDLGRIIIKANSEGACKKYGENHSKLAEELSMVFFKRKGSIHVMNTAFGNFSVDLSESDRLELVKRLALRNEFLQKIIYMAKKGKVNYMNLAMDIVSEKTAIRRKSNVKMLLFLILGDSELFNNIIW